jgi:glycosyltransferase involved in cell wall biosynthesis
VTDFSRDWLRRRCPEWAGKIERVYNGIHPGELAPPEAAPIPEIVSVGRLIEKKGFGELIQACGMLRDRGLDFVCRIIGGGPLEEALREQIAQAGLADRVILEGPRSEAEVTGFLRRARVFALACVHDSEGGSDNLPTVIMEAMAAGLPVVSTRVAGVPEMIEDGATGRLLDEHDIAGVADAIEAVLKDAGLARRWGVAGRAMVEKVFATERTTSQLKHLLVKRAGVWPRAGAIRMDPALAGEALKRLLYHQ